MELPFKFYTKKSYNYPSKDLKQKFSANLISEAHSFLAKQLLSSVGPSRASQTTCFDSTQVAEVTQSSCTSPVMIPLERLNMPFNNALPTRAGGWRAGGCIVMSFLLAFSGIRRKDFGRRHGEPYT